MPDWSGIERHLVQAWGAYQRASHASPVEAMASLADLLRASRELEREAEGVLSTFEGRTHDGDHQVVTVVGDGAYAQVTMVDGRQLLTVESRSSSLTVVDGRMVEGR